MKQKDVIEILKLGYNAFLTGPAGSGKTFLLNKYINYLKKNKIKVSITASTGIAATHLDGRTVHSWCGIGINEKMTDSQIKKLRGKNVLLSRIMSTKVLIIDEISMLNASRLDLIDRVCKVLRQDLRPFGGVQVVLCGDFFQLPPVAKGEEDGRFVTESDIWGDMNINICYLEEQYRQNDKKFLGLLNDIRGNTAGHKTYNMLLQRLNKQVDFKIKPTKLHTHKMDVDAYNNFELNKLKGEESVYEMYSEGIPFLVQSLKDGYCLAPETLKLKVDTVVMFVRNNFAKGFVNGTLGKVVRFDENDGYPVIETLSGKQIIAFPEKWMIEEGGEVVASVSQVPLRLAWAITVHKSQGMSLDCAEIDLSKTFEYGMGYVALSRVRSLDGIKLVGINELALKVDDKAIKLDEEFIKRSQGDLLKCCELGKSTIKKMQKLFIKNNKPSDSIGGMFEVEF